MIRTQMSKIMVVVKHSAPTTCPPGCNVTNDGMYLEAHGALLPCLVQGDKLGRWRRLTFLVSAVWGSYSVKMKGVTEDASILRQVATGGNKPIRRTSQNSSTLANEGTVNKMWQFPLTIAQ